jgi:hypothetical protein
MTSHGKLISSAKNSTTNTNAGSTMSGGTRVPNFLPEKTGSFEIIRKAMTSVYTTPSAGGILGMPRKWA